MNWIESAQGGVLLRLQIQPRASRTEWVGLHGEPPRLRLRIAAPPVDQAANDELISFLRKTLGVPAGRIELVRGHKSKAKDVLVSGVNLEAIRTKLLSCMNP
jgi:hypothetical protein